MKKKILALVLVFAIALALGIGGTMAWLTAESKSVVNTFTVGDITIDLNETDVDEDGNTKANAYKVGPGSSYAKDPYVTIAANSEACWLFVKVEESGGIVEIDGKNTQFSDFLSYTVNTSEDEWTEMPGKAGYYYRSVSATGNTDSDPIYILTGEGSGANKNGYVSVKNTVTKAMGNKLDVEKKTTTTNDDIPTLTFSAAAVQSENVNTVTEAWNALPKTFTGTEPTNP